MAERSFAGFTYSQRLTVGFYGEVYRGRTASDTEVEVLHLDPHLAQQPGFAEALTRHGTELGLLQHKNAVSTLTMGKASDGAIVVITEPTTSSHTVEEVLELARNAGSQVPVGIALTIARSAIAGLACAHNVNIVHGGIHPRSVVISRKGEVRVTDFAAARALAIAAAGSDDAELYKGFGGYLAPELALGDPPSSAVDVYAMGALIFTLLNGEPPPGELDASARVKAVVTTALATGLDKRFADARELEREFEMALAEDGCHMASPDELARYLGKSRASTEQRLDAGLDDLLSSLDDDEPAAEPEPAPEPAPASEAKAGRARRVGDLPGLVISGDEEEVTDVQPQVIAEQTEGDHDEEETLVAPETTDLPEDTSLTQVDPQPQGQASRDPISELIELDKDNAPTGQVDLHDGASSNYDDGHTPLPPPAADAPGTYTRSGQEILNPKGKRTVEEAALSAIDSLDDDDEDEIDGHDTIRRDKPKQAKALAKATALEERDPELSLKKSNTAMWMGITVLSLLGMLAFLYFKTDLFHPERKRARDEARKKKQAQIDEDSKPPPVGVVSIQIDPPNSAVWLSLGTAPAKTPLLVPSSTVWQLRFDKQGFKPKDVNVVASHWSGSGKGRKADVKATLSPGTVKKMRAAPRPPKPAEQSGLRDGQGKIHADSQPSGSEVWLFLGIGDLQSLSVEAGKAYRFKLDKDGYEPAFVEIGASAWKGPSGERISKTVELKKRKKK